MTTSTPLDRFETELLAELRQHVAERTAEPRPKSRPVRRHLVAVAACAAVVVAVGVGGLALRPDSAAAFSVEQQSDGDVVVTIHDMSDADGLEQALAEHGVTADVSYDPDLLTYEVQNNPGDQPPVGIAGGLAPRAGDPPTQIALPPGWPGVDVERADGGGATFTLLAECIGPESVLHLVTTGSADEFLGIFVTWENSSC
ncbi:MAG TPA: hypothetical protein VE442_23705 [Jatrophihabitans sp.]|nr:hypothetical protein [Jatrophihabitans sp.]